MVEERQIFYVEVDCLVVQVTILDKDILTRRIKIIRLLFLPSIPFASRQGN